MSFWTPAFGRGACSVASFAYTLVFAPISDVRDSRGTQDHSVVGIVGHWTHSTDDGQVSTADGRQWTGVTERGTLAQASRRWFGTLNDTLIANWSAPGAFPLAVHGATSSFGAGTIRVDFKLLGGASDQNAGIVFDLHANGEYLYVRYNTKDGDLALWRFAHGERTRIAHGTGTAAVPLGVWHTLEVTLQGRELRARVLGAPELALAQTLETAPLGRVGLWTKRDAVTAFRAFQVLPAAP